MSDDTTAKPAVAQPVEAESGAATNGSAAESTATVAVTKTSESEKSGAAVADDTTEKVQSDDKGKVSLHKAIYLAAAGRFPLKHHAPSWVY